LTLAELLTLYSGVMVVQCVHDLCCVVVAGREKWQLECWF
jgi:hypothetical protein